MQDQSQGCVCGGARSQLKGKVRVAGNHTDQSMFSAGTGEPCGAWDRTSVVGGWVPSREDPSLELECVLYSSDLA